MREKPGPDPITDLHEGYCAVIIQMIEYAQSNSKFLPGSPAPMIKVIIKVNFLLRMTVDW